MLFLYACTHSTYTVKYSTLRDQPFSCNDVDIECVLGVRDEELQRKHQHQLKKHNLPKILDYPLPQPTTTTTIRHLHRRPQQHQQTFLVITNAIKIQEALLLYVMATFWNKVAQILIDLRHPLSLQEATGTVSLCQWQSDYRTDLKQLWHSDRPKYKI